LSATGWRLSFSVSRRSEKALNLTPSVFYDVSRRKVEVLAIVAKAQADAWLSKAGERS
jgi:hypothetical protein